MMLDRLFQLFDVFCPPFSEGCLCLSVTLLAFFGGSIDLFTITSQRSRTRHLLCSKARLKVGNGVWETGFAHRFTSAFALLLLRLLWHLHFCLRTSFAFMFRIWRGGCRRGGTVNDNIIHLAHSGR